MADNHENNPDAVWKLIKKIGTAMFVTRDGEGLEGRPLQGHPDQASGGIFFMTDAEHIIKQVTPTRASCSASPEPGPTTMSPSTAP
jgi:hypothetical protein